jgi:D-arginine dehydrogenase
MLYLATEEQAEKLSVFASAPDIAPFLRHVDTTGILELCPVLRPEYAHSGVLEQGAADIDVDALHQAYLRRFKALGGKINFTNRIDKIERSYGGWKLSAGTATFRAKIIVNAAGAWADEIASLAGVRPVGISAFRRTALLVDAPGGIAIESWPFVIDIDEKFYFKPDAGLILMSPADETEQAAGDAQPDEWDIAVAVDRVTTAANIPVRHIKRSWAGLRSFAKDRTPVVGYDNDSDGFFWLAGQGGYGVQTAPAMARLAAALVKRETLPEDLVREGVRATDFRPGRFR